MPILRPGALLLAALLVPRTAPLGAQSLTGYPASRAAAQRAAEAAAVARPDTARVGALARALADRPHIAGTLAQARTRDLVVEALKAAGIATEVREYRVWLPHTVDYGVWRVQPDPKPLELREGRLPEDPTTMQYDEYPTVNGYSGTGDVTGEVVYVNYGLVEDYAVLDSMGVSVKGKVAIARYGRSFRGIKAREAEKHGAVALLMYSDPADDGYVQGDVYPEGPFRNARGVQRGSVMNGAGDPSTPGYPSLANAARIPVAEMPVPRIPVLPLSYGNAIELLQGVRGAQLPRGWQGGLAFRYHVGPGPVQARVKVWSDSATAAVKSIWDTFGVIRGTDFPDEVIVIGGHRDAWSPGAIDNVSGTVSVVEAARAVAEQMKAGWRPRRTLLFATWDAEEWGLVGSTEYVEDDSLRLMRGGVAYLNQDVSASGPAFGGGGTPTLRGVLRDVTRAVPDPSGGGSVYDVWRRRSGVREGEEPAMGDPGGGSDFAGFYNHLGIPHSDWGFGGANGVYHFELRLVHLHGAVRRSRVPLPRGRGTDRDAHGDAARERGRPAVRLRRVRAHHASLPEAHRRQPAREGLARFERAPRRRDRPYGACGAGLRDRARCGARRRRGAGPAARDQRGAAPGRACDDAARGLALAAVV